MRQEALGTPWIHEPHASQLMWLILSDLHDGLIMYCYLSSKVRKQAQRSPFTCPRSESQGSLFSPGDVLDSRRNRNRAGRLEVHIWAPVLTLPYRGPQQVASLFRTQRDSMSVRLRAAEGVDLGARLLGF